LAAQLRRDARSRREQEREREKERIALREEGRNLGMRRSMCRCLAPGNPGRLFGLPLFIPLNTASKRTALYSGAPFGR